MGVPSEKLLLLTIIVCLVFYLLFKNSFGQTGTPICGDNYAVNVNFYILLGLCIIMFVMAALKKQNAPITRIKGTFAGVIAIILAALIIQSSPNVSVAVSHLVWVCFLIAAASFFYTIWKYYDWRGILPKTLKMVAISIVVLLIANLCGGVNSTSTWAVVVVPFICAGAEIMRIKDHNNTAITATNLTAASIASIVMILIIIGSKSSICKQPPNYPAESLKTIAGNII